MSHTMIRGRCQTSSLGVTGKRKALLKVQGIHVCVSEGMLCHPI